MRERNQTLDVIKGIAIILVMIGHCMVLNGMEDDIVYDGIAAVQMPLFVIVSGYVLGLGRIPSDIKELGAKIKKAAVHYLVPFFSWMVIAGLGNLPAYCQAVFFQLDKGLWFLMTIFIISTLTRLSLFVSSRYRYSKILFLLCMAGVEVLFFLQARMGNTFLSPNLTITYLPFYVQGYILAAWLVPLAAEQNHKIKGILWAPVVLWALCMFVILIVKRDMMAIEETQDLIYRFLAGFLGCFLCVFLAKKIPFQKMLAWIGTYTLEIYVLHFRFATLLGLSNRNLTIYSAEGILWLVAAFVVMSICTAFGIYMFKTLWITDFLLFGNVGRSCKEGLFSRKRN